MPGRSDQRVVFAGRGEHGLIRLSASLFPEDSLSQFLFPHCQSFETPLGWHSEVAWGIQLSA